MNKFKDPKGMIDAVYSFADYIEGASEIGKKISLRKKYNNIYNIVIAGMGGSAIGGDINNMLLRDDLAIPLIVSRNYIFLNGLINIPLSSCHLIQEILRKP